MKKYLLPVVIALFVPFVALAVSVPWNRPAPGFITPLYSTDFAGIGTTTPAYPLTISTTVSGNTVPLYLHNSNLNNSLSAIIQNSTMGSAAQTNYLVCNEQTGINAGCPSYQGSFGITSVAYAQANVGEAPGDVHVRASDSNLDLEAASTTGPSATNFYNKGISSQNLTATLTATTSATYPVLGVGTNSTAYSLNVVTGTTTTGVYSVATTSSKQLEWMTTTGVVYSGGDAPTLSSCGTSPAVASGSNNNAGRIVIGSGVVTSCTVTFADGGWTATQNAPACDANTEGGITVFTAASSTPTSMVITGASAINGDTVTYQCKGF